MKILILTPLTHFYSPLVLRTLFSELAGKEFEIHAILTPKISSKKRSSSSLRSIIRNSGLRYLLLMMATNLKYDLLRLGEAVTRCPLPCRRFLTPPDACAAFGVPAMVFPNVNGRDCVEAVRSLAPDLILCVFFNQILKTELLGCAKEFCLNLHPSLLPAYKGMTPILWMLAEGAETGGVTIHRLTDELDAGAIIAQEAFPITPSDSVFTTYSKAAAIGGHLLARLLLNWRNRPAETPQPREAGKIYGPITREAVSRIAARHSFLRFRK